ncbi:Rieske domain protein, partial [Globisporangium splendens]
MAIRLSRMRSEVAVALRLQSRALCSCSGNSSASSASTPSAAPRVLCSVAELLALDGKALKFPLVIDSEQPPSVDANAEAPPAAKPRASKARSLATGFVFFCADSQQPRAFVNSCPHARLELDFDDSDFFCEGFIQCKVHGAFFDPHSNTLEDEEHLSAYRLEKQKELAAALASRTDDVLSMQQMLHEKTMARMQKYNAAKSKPGAKA